MHLAPALALAAICAAGQKTTPAPLTGVASVQLPAVAPLQLSPGTDAKIPQLPLGPLQAQTPAMTTTPMVPSLPASAQAASASGPREATAQISADAPSSAPVGWGQKMTRLLATLVNPFGSDKKGEEPPVISEAERLDGEFAKLNVWGQVAPAVREEIEALRARKLRRFEISNHVAKEGNSAMKRILERAGSENLGFHYNLHRGRREDFVGEGIHATMGDITLNYSMYGDRNLKVYFYQSREHGLYRILDEDNPQLLFFRSRMGYALSVFRLDDPALTAAMADGRIKDFGNISMDFHGMRGVPYSAYVAPPLEVFIDVKKRLGMGKISRDEETLATVRYLEAALAAGPAYIPK